MTLNSPLYWSFPRPSSSLHDIKFTTYACDLPVNIPREQNQAQSDIYYNRPILQIKKKKKKKKKKKVWFYIALYPIRWTAQSALHFPPLADLFIPTPFSASLGSILAMQQLRNDYSLTFPPLSIARYSFIQLSRLRRREVKENAQTSKR